MSVVIPFEQLRPETLNAVIEEFVTRDGAVHGHVESSLGKQVEAVRCQLRSGRVVLVFDEATESCTILPSGQARPTDQPADPS
jgi:uncharacterized protein YheU (UPF0270 family)